MNQYIYTQIIKYCEDSAYKEVCGIVLNIKGKASFYPCKNISTNPTDEFILDPIDYAKAGILGDIIYIVHSHVNTPERASKHDIASCNAGKVPWIIYSLVTKKYIIIYPDNKPLPIIGRDYYYGVQDCWSLIVDIYRQELNIDLVYPADPDPDWWLHGKNYFNDLIDMMGFEVVQDNSIKKYDIILMQTGKSPFLNHSALYYGDNIIIHHAFNRLSCKEVYGGYWSKVTGKVARYKGKI